MLSNWLQIINRVLCTFPFLLSFECGRCFLVLMWSLPPANLLFTHSLRMQRGVDIERTRCFARWMSGNRESKLFQTEILRMNRNTTIYWFRFRTCYSLVCTIHVSPSAACECDGIRLIFKLSQLLISLISCEQASPGFSSVCCVAESNDPIETFSIVNTCKVSTWARQMHNVSAHVSCSLDAFNKILFYCV